jgi:thiamine-phosphate pyrophosphorylase
MFTRPSIYPIVDTSVCGGRGLDPFLTAEAYLRGGARILQLRQKAGGSAAFLELARRIAGAARRFDAVLIVNDRADVATLAGAGGVHVGQDDLSVEQIRGIAGAGAIVGLSTHDPRQVDEGLAGSASYIAVGPIYQTTTKETGYRERGPDLVRHAARRGKPVVGIGGITLDRVPELIAAGADGLAVISDLLATGDPEGRVRAYVRALA